MGTGNEWAMRHRVSRRAVLRGAVAIGGGLAGAALLGCDDDDDDDGGTTPSSTSTAGGGGTATATTAPEGQAKPGGMLGTTGNIPSDNFNPVTNYPDANSGMGLTIYDRLMSSRLGEPGYLLEAAESVEVVDETTIVFKLKEGLVYQDREPVNGRGVVADDIVQMQLYARDEANAQDNSFQKNSLASVEATDDRTVVFHLQGPDAYLFSGTRLGHAANMCIVPSELVLGDLNTSLPVGSGPYQLKSHQFGVRYEYERNPTYRDAAQGLPYIDTRVWLPMTDFAAVDAAFRSEQIHRLFGPPPEIADALEADLGDQLTVNEFVSTALMVRSMSAARELFEDIRIREAFYRWFDAAEYIDLVVGGKGVAVPGYVPAGLSDYQLDPSETEQTMRFDPEESRKLLEAAGFDFDKEYLFSTSTSGDGMNQPSIEIAAQQARRVGINNIAFGIGPSAEWSEQYSQTGNFDFVVVFFRNTDTPQLPLRLQHTTPNNRNAWFGLKDPEVDALIEESERLIDREAHIEKVKDVQRALAERYANMGPVFSPIQRELVWSYVKDWELNTEWPTHTNYQTRAWIDK
jgi:peptide/nickel transport system substrate-binding protein